MNGRECVKAAFRGETVERIPWVPFVGCHGGALIDVGADEYLTSVDHIVKGTAEAVKRYRPDGLPVMFDLQIEAEVLGCELAWANENPPAVVSHPLENGSARLEDLRVPSAGQGRIPVAIQATRKLREQYPELALYGLVTGPYTLALHLLGTSIFMKMLEDEALVHLVVDFCRKVTCAMADYYIEAGADIVAVVDPMTSQIGPEQFKQFVSPPATEVFEHIRAGGALSSFFVCGHAQQNIEVMCECKPDNVSIDENIPLDYVRDICQSKGISFGGNLQLTVVLLLGSQDDVKRNTIACMETGGMRGFILAPGCDLPYATPPANLETVAAVVNDPYEQEIARTLSAGEAPGDLPDMSDYGKSDTVIVDVVTLDSESCAPCQYMVEAVKAVTPQFEGIVEWREHKIKQPESIAFMTALMVKNIPTICIDGRITFVSRIPRKEELIAAIQKRIIEKLSFKIKQKNGTVYVLGESEEECTPIKANVSQAIQELGSGTSIQTVTDPKEIASFGVLRTPAVVVAKNTVKAEGRVPTTEVIKEWVKEIA